MKQGVYINLKNDRGDLCYFNGEKLEMLEELSLLEFEVDIDYNLNDNAITANFSKLEYLGKL